MRKLWIASALLAACSFAGAQTIGPTSDTTAPDQVNRGSTTATVTQKVTLNLPQATALHLSSSNLVFDISKIGQQDNTWYCAYGLPEKDGVARDVSTTLGDNFWGQTQVLPLGTYYNTAAYPNINIVAGPQVTQYPPAIIGQNGKVDNYTKSYIVCYRTFVLQKFSNVGNFRLSVTRDNPTGDTGHQMLYLQDDPCDTWGAATGLYKVDEGKTFQLLPKNLTKGTTGAKVRTASDQNFCRQYTSWLDDVIVVAVVIDGDKAGMNTATLTYTLESSTAGW